MTRTYIHTQTRGHTWQRKTCEISDRFCFAFWFVVLVLHGEKVKGGIWDSFYGYVCFSLTEGADQWAKGTQPKVSECFFLTILMLFDFYVITGLQREIFIWRFVFEWREESFGFKKNWMFLSRRQQREREYLMLFLRNIFWFVCFFAFFAVIVYF